MTEEIENNSDPLLPVDDGGFRGVQLGTLRTGRLTGAPLAARPC